MRGLLALAAALVFSSGAPAATKVWSYYLPVWSPDGTQIAFEADPWNLDPNAPVQIWTANADGSGKRELVGRLKNGLFQIAWPKPQELLYDANFSTLAVDPGTRAHRPVLSAQGSTFTSDAAADRVASTCDRCNGPIVLVDVATGKRVRFGGGNADVNKAPALSPDGTRIAFTHSTFDPKKDGYTFGGLWTARTDGSHRRRIVSNGICPVWSPTGREIAFATAGPKGLSTWEVRPDGTGTRLLLKTNMSMCNVPSTFAWSPDGKSIAYKAYKTGLLSILDVATRQVAAVPAIGEVIGLAWSPDSSRLLVAARPSETDCSSLWEVGADGTGATVIRKCAGA